jgi:hypothetical protein
MKEHCLLQFPYGKKAINIGQSADERLSPICQDMKPFQQLNGGWRESVTNSMIA